MRILFLSPHMPSPLKGRTLNFVRHAAARHELHLRILASPFEPRTGDATAELTALRPRCASVEVIEVATPRFLAAGAVGLLRGDDLRSAWTRAHDRCSDRLQRQCDRLAIDVVHADRMRVGRIAARLGRPVLADLPDCLSWAMAQWSARARGMRRLLYAYEARRLRAYEGGDLNALPAAAVASAEDGRRLLASGYRGRVVYLPGIIELARDEIPVTTAAAGGPHLIFHGTLYYRPNVDAVATFVREVLPLLRRRFPRLTLSLVGARPRASVRRLGRVDGVRVVADVPHVAPWLRAATAAVIPMRIGVGHSQKVCEALLAGRPVICSPQVADCVDATLRPALQIARQPSDWLAQVERLLEDRDGVAAQARLGPEAVRRCYGADAVMPLLERAYETAREAWGPPRR